MAKRPALPPATAIRALADGQGRLALRVTPGASAEAIALGDAGLAVRVTAAPEAGKANAAVLALLARALGVPKTSLEIVRGDTGRDKLVQLPPA